MGTSESSHPLRQCASLHAGNLLHVVGKRSSRLVSCHQWDLMNISRSMGEEPTFSLVWDGFMDKDWVLIIKDSLHPRQPCGRGGSTGPLRSTATKEQVSS